MHCSHKTCHALNKSYKVGEVILAILKYLVLLLKSQKYIKTQGEMSATTPKVYISMKHQTSIACTANSSSFAL